MPVEVEGRARALAAAQTEDVDLRAFRIASRAPDVLGFETARFEPDAEQFGALPVGIAGRVDRRHADQLRREVRRLLTADGGLGQDPVDQTRRHSGAIALY